MSERDQLITRCILGFLDKLNGAQAIETIIHAQVQTEMRNVGEPAASLVEFDTCLRQCDRQGWVTGVAARVTKQMKWSLSDEGKAALLEMR